MDVLIAGWLVLNKQWNSILSILSIFLLGGGIMLLWLKLFFNGTLTKGEYFSLSLGGALFPVALGMLISLLLNFLFGLKVSFLIICLLIFVVSYFAVYQFSMRNWPRGLNSNYSSLLSQNKQSFLVFFTTYNETVIVFILFLLFIASVFARLAFISGLITPLYFDSATHYSIIQGLISKIQASSLATIDNLVEGYYHLGYHVIIASIHLALNLDVKDAMLIFGQIILAIIPLPLFFIIRRETRMDIAGIFATLLAAWGWSMPAYSLNWGKYPALTSILPFEFILCSIYLILRSPQRYRWILVIFSSFCLLVSTFIHTRSLVLVIIAIFSGAFSLIWYRLSRLTRTITLAMIGVGIATLIYIVQSKPVLNLLFQPYWEDGRWILLLVLILFPFALKKFPAAAFSGILSLLLLLASLFIPIDQLIPGYDAQTLLDRPFVEMVLFFPLAFLGGLGYAGLIKSISNVGSFQNWIKALVVALLFGALALNTTQYKFSPSEYSLFFVEDDAVALDWMDRNLPLNSNILVSSSEDFILETQSPTSFAGTDGGIWINPLIHRNVSYAGYQIDFSQKNILDNLCKDKVTYVYVGGVPESFDSSLLQKRPDWYGMTLLLSRAQVYKVIGCH